MEKCTVSGAVRCIWRCWGWRPIHWGRPCPANGSAEKAPWRPAPWEKGGRIYLKLGIRKWKDHLPDMSRLMPDMVRKDLGSDPAVLVQETCVAECVHWALTLLSAGIFFLWRSGWAALLWLVYNVLGNVSFIVIQRYNRPRLQKLAEKTRRKPV